MAGEHADDGTAATGPSAEAGGTDFGWWPSPWSAARVAAGKVGRSGLATDGGVVYWSESRPGDGRQVVVGHPLDGGAPDDVSPPGVSVRSRVHEYGGGAATVHDGVLYYVDQDDQQWYRVAVGRREGPVGPEAVTRSTDGSGWSTRHADGRVTPSGRWLVSVEERHRDTETDHRLVAHRVGSGEPSAPVVLADGSDFVAAPRPSPDGRFLAWVSWDHPAMPWDRSELRVAPLVESATTIGIGDHRLVAGGAHSSVGQPLWGRDASLYFVDDRTGWWQPYRLAADHVGVEGSEPEPLVDTEAEFHVPDWVFGQSTMAERRDGALVCRRHVEGRDQVVVLHPAAGSDDPGRSWSVEVVDQPCVAIDGLVMADAGGEHLVVLGATPDEPRSVYEVPVPGQGEVRRLSAGPADPVSADSVSVSMPFTALTSEGPVPGLFYPPVGAPVGAAAGPPPLVVFCHGGPTSAADAGLDPIVQFFTGRGLAVAAVNYRGSSGFGRAYRQRLDGLWGEADIDDCASFATALAEAGLVDGDRMAIRGTSSGGLTALGALVRSDRFAGAAAWYGVTDLAALATDTHDFESRYLDSLVGPWPEAAQRYRERSPLFRVEEMSGSVLLIQGRDDRVVPADQSERFAAALEARGVSCRLILFDGEAHGFRQAATIEASLLAELDFYRSLFAGPVAPAPVGPGS